jgi:proline-rich protein PRCC
MFAALPGPAEGKRVVVRLQPPAELAPDSDSDSDSDPSDPADPAAKRRATAPASAKISLAASLPQPKNAGFGRGQGGGAAIDLGGDRGGGTALDLGADRAIAAAGPEPAAGPSLHPSQLYAVDADTGAYARAASGDFTPDFPTDARRPEHPGSIPRGPDVEAAFAYVRGGGARGPGAGGGEAPKVREMNLDALRAEASRGRADGVAGATAGATGLAFGDEFREKLAREAGAKPSAAHRSKNQIGSLLYNAKQAEMQIMEGRLAGVSH